MSLIIWLFDENMKFIKNKIENLFDYQW